MLLLFFQGLLLLLHLRHFVGMGLTLSIKLMLLLIVVLLQLLMSLLKSLKGILELSFLQSSLLVFHVSTMGLLIKITDLLVKFSDLPLLFNSMLLRF